MCEREIWLATDTPEAKDSLNLHTLTGEKSSSLGYRRGFHGVSVQFECPARPSPNTDEQIWGQK